MDSTDDFIGRAIIEPEDCAIVTQQQLQDAGNDELRVYVEPRWHPIFIKTGEPYCGEVLIRFVVTDYDFNFRQSA